MPEDKNRDKKLQYPDEDLDERNREAPHTNPSSSHIRTGNPQLDKSAQKEHRERDPEDRRRK